MTIKFLVLISLFFFMLSCEKNTDFYPKPRGYMRLDFPERSYAVYQADSCSFQFEIPEYFEVIDKANCNKDIQMDRFNATLFLTYIPIDTNLSMNTEYARKLVYDHSIKADAIDEIALSDPERDAYGVKYDIKGDAASPYQFYITDSTSHFLRGALYFNVKPNYDSIRTSLNYIVEDLDKMLETVRWK